MTFIYILFITAFITHHSATNTKAYLWKQRLEFDDPILNEPSFYIVHTSDINSRFEQIAGDNSICYDGDRDCLGGICRLHSYISDFKDQHCATKVIVLNTGNTFKGELKANVKIEITKYLNNAYTVLGTNDFSRKDQSLDYITSPHITVLGNNVKFFPNTKFSHLQKHILPFKIEQIGDRAIGIVGFTSSSISRINYWRELVHLEDDVTSIKEAVDNLRSLHNVSVIVVVGHASEKTSQLILDMIPDIDIMVTGGISSDVASSPSGVLKVKKYPRLMGVLTGYQSVLLRSYGYTKYLGLSKFVFRSDYNVIDFDCQLIHIGAHIQASQSCIKFIKREAVVEQLLKPVSLGEMIVVADNIRFDCRSQECNLGNLAVDAMVYQFARTSQYHYWTEAPIAILHAGTFHSSINTTINRGYVTTRDLHQVLLYDIPVVLLKMNGTQLQSMFEESVYHNGGEEFLQVSGLIVQYDFTKPPGMRVRKVYAQCGDCANIRYDLLRHNAQYGVLTSWTLYHEGGILSTLHQVRPYRMVDYTLNDMLKGYLRMGLGFRPEINGRISFVNDAYIVEGREHAVRMVIVIVVLDYFH